MKEDDRLREMCELTRHLDSLLWTVTSLWAGAIGGLLVYCTGKESFDPWLASLGLIFTPGAMFFAANFRRLRQSLHNRMPDELRELYISEDPGRQWYAFLVIFLVLVLAWTRLSLSQAGSLCGWWLIFGLLDVAAVVGLWCYGNSGTA